MPRLGRSPRHVFGETVLSQFISLFQSMLRSPKSRSRRSSLSMNFILSNFFSFWDYFNQKRIKNVIPYDTVAPDARPIRTRTSLRSLDKLDSLTRCVFCRSLSSSLFSSLVAFSRWFVLLLFISISKEELFLFSNDSRAKSARDDAARSASFFEY